MSKVIYLSPDNLPEVKKLAGGNGGGSMEDRVKALEDNVGQIRVDIADIKARLPYLSTQSSVDAIASRISHLATQSALESVKGDIVSIKECVSHLATQSALEAVKGDISSIKVQIPHLATKAELHDLKASLIQWMVGVMLASAGLAATISFGLARLLK